MAKEKKCKYCTDIDEDDDDIYPDILYHGTHTITVNSKHLEPAKDISVEIEFDANRKYMLASTWLFGTHIFSNEVKVKYCPFCGRKL